MAAGLGFKNFVTGEVLTAGDVNGYLMQGVLVFASAAARNAAITSPQEGQFAYTKDTNGLWYYDGAAWVASGATGDIEGVTAGVGISGGGTSGTVTITNSMATEIATKGDLIAGTGSQTFDNLTVGANNTVLTADSTTATGLKWATPTTAAKSYALLNAGGTSLTAATTITVSGLSGYDNLAVVVVDASAGANSTFTMRFNADSGANYVLAGPNLVWATTYASGNFSRFGSVGTATKIDIGQLAGNTSSSLSGGLLMFGANSTGGKAYMGSWGSSDGGANNNAANTLSGLYMGTSVVSSVSIISDTGNFDAGKIYIYGAV